MQKCVSTHFVVLNIRFLVFILGCDNYYWYFIVIIK